MTNCVNKSTQNVNQQFCKEQLQILSYLDLFLKTSSFWTVKKVILCIKPHYLTRSTFSIVLSTTSLVKQSSKIYKSIFWIRCVNMCQKIVFLLKTIFWQVDFLSLQDDFDWSAILRCCWFLDTSKNKITVFDWNKLLITLLHAYLLCLKW